MTTQPEGLNFLSKDRILGEMVNRLVKSIAPKMILLFGSRVGGAIRADSDYDLLIIWRDENPPALRAAAVRKILADIGVPLDIAVVTPSEFDRFRVRRTHIVAIADREGQILHAA